VNILITRAHDQQEATAKIFATHGLQAFALPLISYEKLEAKFAYTSYDLCVLTSPAAAGFLAPYLQDIELQRYAAVGAKTSLEIATQLNVHTVLAPERAYQAELLKLLAQEDLHGKRVLAPGPQERTGDMRPFFEAAGAIYDRVDCYKTIPQIYPDNTVNTFLEEHRIDAITFFSPSAVAAFFAQAELPTGMMVAAVGTTTANALSTHGVPAIMPEKQSAEAMAELLYSRLFR
jgi:uroporphyrinogen-III synthase